MKNYLSLLLAVTTVFSFSCTKELDNQNLKAPSNSHVVFKARVSNNPLSKATITPNGGDTVFSSAWEGTDAVNLYALSDSFDEEAQADWNPSTQAFEGDFSSSAPGEKEEWMYEAKYPYDDDGNIPFGSVREQKGNAYNSAYDIMYGTVSYTNAFLGKDNSGNVFVIPMTRLTGIAYFHITGGSSSDDVLSATLTVNSGNIAAETVAINGSGDAVVPTNGTNSITINFPSGYRPKADDIKLWFNVLPGTYSGMKLVVRTATKAASIASNKSITYTAGELNKAVFDGLNWVNTTSHSITWTSSSEWDVDVTDGIGINDGDYTVKLHQASAGNAPLISSKNDARVYANGEVDVLFDGLAMSRIVFNLSSQGQTKLAPITASVGTISTQKMGDATVVWTGKANEVTFTVGSKVIDDPSANGQLCFDSIDIETVDDGKSDPGLAFANGSYTALTNAAFVAPTLTNPHSLSVSYSSTNTSVATVDPSTGAISVVNKGETTIKATFAGDATYRAAVASYTLTVADPSIVASATTPAKAGYSDNSEVTFTVTANCTWEPEKGTDDNNIIKSINVSESTVTVRFNSNTAESEKTATVNLNQTGTDNSPITVPVTVTQNAKPGAAANGTTLWSEDFTGKTATGTGTQASYTCNTSNVYGGATVTYTFADNGSNRTQIYEANNAGGTSPELLIGKTSGSFTVSGIPSGAAKGMTLTYVANGSLSISSTTGDVTVDALSTASNPRTYRVNNPDSEEFITLVFSNTSASNVRIDNIELEAGAPAAGITVTTAAASDTETVAGTTATLNGTLSLINGAVNSSVTEAGFYYKLSSAVSYTKVTCASAPTSTTSFSYGLTGLTTDSEYTYYAYAVYASGSEVTGEDTAKTFTPTCGGGGDVEVLNEEFDNSTTSDSSTAFGTSKFSNFSGETSKAFTSKYGGVKFGTGSAAGYITSKSLNLSNSFTVKINVLKYGTDTGKVQVTVGTTTKEITPTDTDTQYTLEFAAATASSTVKIGTSSKRAYIDNVIIIRHD